MKKSLTIILCFVFFGCQLTVDIDVPFEKPQLTLNSLFNPDSVWNVQLNLNRHILDKNPFAAVDNAQVTILENGNVVETLVSKGKGVYKSLSGKPFAGRTYTVKAVAGDYGTVQSTASVPLPVENLQATFHEPYQGESGVESVIDIKFDDRAGEKNFYKITAYGESYSVRPNKLVAKTFGPLTLKLAGTDNDDYGSEDIVFSDLIFDGQTHEMSITVRRSFSGFSNIIVSVWSISEEYYNYKQTLQLQSETRDNPFAQPVNVFNNIEGGYGFFGGYIRSNVQSSGEKPTIKNITPLKGKVGDRVILTYEINQPAGTAASPSGPQNIVYFNGVDNFIPAQMVRQTSNTIEFNVPQRSITGNLLVFINGFPIFSNQVFDVTN